MGRVVHTCKRWMDSGAWMPQGVSGIQLPSNIRAAGMFYVLIKTTKT